MAGAGGTNHNEGYRTPSLSLADASTGLRARATPPIFPKRARQIQADEGIIFSPFFNNTSMMPEATVSSDQPSSRSVRGRARAGTLPSNWGNNTLTSLSIDPDITKSSDADFLNRLSAVSTPLVQDSRLQGFESHLASFRQHSDNFGDFESSAANNTNRLRSGSLTLPLQEPFGNAFGPSIFSTNWQPTRSALRSVTMSDEHDSGLGPISSEDEFGSRDIFDGSDTLDYLGLADSASRNGYQPNETDDDDDMYHHVMQHAFSSRSRALTLASSMVRPRQQPLDGRARSSSILPSIKLEATLENMNESGRDPHSHLDSAQNALFSASLQQQQQHHHHHHHHLQNDTYSPHVNQHQQQSPLGARPRATSMGVLDQISLAPETPSLPLEIDYETARNYAIEKNLDIDKFLEFGLNSGLRITRNRAGTIAALSGPGGRQRTEQELVRMAQMGSAPSKQPGSRCNPMSMSGFSSPDEPACGISQSTPSTPSGFQSQQPTRSLWIGQLAPNMASHEIMQIFARYGAVESLRLVPEKGCAFVNYVEIQDAITAREDIMNRLGGRIGIKANGPAAAVRIGFGKPDSVPTAPNSSHTNSFGFPSPNLDHNGVEAGSSPFGDSPNAQPTRALWVGSIPATTTISSLLSVFAPFGPVESVRVLSNKNCGFINFETVQDAVRARKALNGRDLLGAEVGGVRIGFAKVPSKNPENNALPNDSSPDFSAAIETLVNLQGAANTASAEHHQVLNGNLENYRSNLMLDLMERQKAAQQSSPTNRPANSKTLTVNETARPTVTNPLGRVGGFPTHSSSNSIVPSSDKGGVPLPAEMRPKVTVSDLQLLMQHLDESDPDCKADVEAIVTPRPLMTYYTRIPLVTEVSGHRKFDSARLREIRKRMEPANCSQAEVDRVAREFLHDLVDLSSDYIGNTLVQRFFEKGSEQMKYSMLEVIAPHLAMIGIHKNGTWAAQKIIDCATTDDQRALISFHLRPYVPPLLLDSFGNYVVQKMIPFGSPLCDFIFDAMVDRCWEIAQGRFGARSMRACLESPATSTFQQKRVALAIILNSVPLATSQNGALLVTWLLDTSSFIGRFRLLAPRFSPHLTNLCTHKLASLTVLRIIGQRLDPQASNDILRVLFDPGKPPQLLEDILTDQIHGSQFITKLLASPFLEPEQRHRFSEDVKQLLLHHKLVGVPAYKSLVESLGLAPPNPNPPQSTLAAMVPSVGTISPTNPSLAAPSGLFPPSARPSSHPPAVGGPTSDGYSGMAYSDGIIDMNLKLAQMSMQNTMANEQAKNANASPISGPMIPGTFDPRPLNSTYDGIHLYQQQHIQPPPLMQTPPTERFNPWGTTSSSLNPIDIYRMDTSTNPTHVFGISSSNYSTAIGNVDHHHHTFDSSINKSFADDVHPFGGFLDRNPSIPGFH